MWDVIMDWGLMKWEYGLLREETVYNYKIYYYAAIIEDAVLRMSWVC
jgi:hypothetical protein